MQFFRCRLICGDVFIQNLLKRKNYKITYPALDENIGGSFALITVIDLLYFCVHLFIYPAEKTKMMEYCKKSNEKCLMRFRMTLGELQNKKEKTPQESAFLDCFRQKMPLGAAPCTVNKICWKIEKEKLSVLPRAAVMGAFDCVLAVPFGRHWFCFNAFGFVDGILLIKLTDDLPQ